MRFWNALISSFLLLTLLSAKSLGERTITPTPLVHREVEYAGFENKSRVSGYRHQPLAGPNPIVQEMIDQVNEDILSTYIEELSGERLESIGGEPYTILTRNSFSGEPVQKASEYLFEHYQAAGLSVVYQNFSIGDTLLRNVIAEMPGSLLPDETASITAHYDNAPTGPIAPGADDNASGTAAVMLAADILSQYEFGCTLRFASFSGEEQGLVGSMDSAKESFCERENFLAVLNLDMIGWNTPGSPAVMELHTNQDIPGSQDIALLYQDVIETYNLALTPEIVFSGISGSDHASYWAYGFPAILAIEDLNDFNPNYHKTTDRIEFLDLPYLTEIAKASLATMAHMSCLVDSGWGMISGTVFDEPNGLPIPDATVSFYHPEWDLPIKTSTNDQGQYNLELPSSDLIVSADAIGFALEQVGLITIAPGGGNSLDIVLQPIPESVNFLPLVQVTEMNPACP